MKKLIPPPALIRMTEEQRARTVARYKRLLSKVGDEVTVLEIANMATKRAELISLKNEAILLEHNMRIVKAVGVGGYVYSNNYRPGHPLKITRIRPFKKLVLISFSDGSTVPQTEWMGERRLNSCVLRDLPHDPARDAMILAAIKPKRKRRKRRRAK